MGDFISKLSGHALPMLLLEDHHHYSYFCQMIHWKLLHIACELWNKAIIPATFLVGSSSLDLINEKHQYIRQNCFNILSLTFWPHLRNTKIVRPTPCAPQNLLRGKYQFFLLSLWNDSDFFYWGVGGESRGRGHVINIIESQLTKWKDMVIVLSSF